MHSKNTIRNRKLVIELASTLLLWAMLLPLAFSAPAPGDLVIPRSESTTISVDFTPEAIFPHWIHRARYRCDACHDDLFKMKLGDTEISKALMKQKLSCAVCHNGEVAFEVGMNTCHRCHRAPEE